MHAGPVMILHVMKKVFVSIGLRQQPLQVSVDFLKQKLLRNRCKITQSFTGQPTVFTDSLQLYMCVLVL